jgi:membrane protein YdbS with pleckstrin-like domain
MARLITDLTARVVIITLITSIVSYLVVQKRPPYQLAIAIPLLFVAFGTVVMINVLFDLWRYHVVDAVPAKK